VRVVIVIGALQVGEKSKSININSQKIGIICFSRVLLL